MTATEHTTVGTTCFCGDAAVEELRDLIAAGMGQVEASHRLWGKPAPAPEGDPPRFRWIGARERSC